MPGSHQSMNAALAIAMLRHQKSIAVSEAAIKAAPLWAHWPARLQRLESGPLADLVPNAQIWLDGGHNPSAGEALGKHFHTNLVPGTKIHIILGMLSNKDHGGFLARLRDYIGSLHAEIGRESGRERVCQYV